MLKSVTPIALGLLLAGCVTGAAVEDADLFSAGNVGRYEAEQATREARAEELSQENAALQSRLDSRLALRDEITRQEAALRTEYESQLARLDDLRRDIDVARAQRKVTESDYAGLLERIRATKAEVARFKAIRDMTKVEIRQGQDVARRANDVIVAYENLSRTGFRNASLCLKGVISAEGCT